MKILLLDNFDSFTYNLYHYLLVAKAEEVVVRLNTEITLAEAGSFDAIVLSPGPGLPKDAGIMPELIKHFHNAVPILGVCLGHQALAEYFGAELFNLPEIFHGVARSTFLQSEKEPMFTNIPNKIKTGRYHSWAVSKQNFPAELEITAQDEKDVIMAFRHRTLPIAGVQFHPESILTDYGQVMISNWVGGLGQFKV